jgi:hypothetical protein
MVSGSHLELMTRFLYSVWQLQVSCCGALSLTWGRVCNLLVQLILGLARAVTLRSKSRRTQTIFYCLTWDSPNLEGQVPVFISARNKAAQKSKSKSKSKSKLFYHLQSVGQSGLVSGTHLGPATNISPSLFTYLETVEGLLIWGALSDERMCL